MGFVMVLLILVLGTGLLIVNRDTGQTFGLENDDFARFLALLPFALLLMAGLFTNRSRLSTNLRFLAGWVLLALLLVTGYQYRQDLATIGNRVMAGLVPGRAIVTQASDGTSEVLLQRGLGGHFVANVTTNGATISMMVDTGASAVVLRAEDASKAGLHPDDLDYRMPVLTANGRAMAAPVRLKRVEIGPIVRENVDGLVAERGRLDQSLLGMSFLSTLDTVQIRSDELRLRD
ncbi:aspartyl protease family protein [Rhizobium paknamense]|uniref:Aspartyl protease family protein n=2 Tax=Rhizobium paknamense TaxID=1206817 RepID=A0ABU0IIZ7_9HYPH|nr:aspartyl protease family protein [Rhizobium paknamense]